MNSRHKQLQRRPATVSVIIATYNRANLLAKTIDSFLSQTQMPSQIIVVDDGSTDGTRETIERYQRKLDDRCDIEIAYRRKANGGKASALNMVLPNVSSDYVWIFDDDDIVLPHALQTHLEFLSAHPEYDFSFSPMLTFSGEFSIDSVDRYEREKFPPIGADDYFPWILEAMRNLMQGMLVPFRCYRDVGKFDESLLRSQDYEMVLRLARRYRAGRIDTPTFALRIHSGRRGAGASMHGEAERLRIWRQYDRTIFARLRVELRLSEYLPRNSMADEELTHEQRRRALMQRAYAMANHGLLEEALEDFASWAREPRAADVAPTRAEQRLLSMLTDVSSPQRIAPASFYYSLGAAARRNSSGLRWLVRGLYWSCARHVRHPLVAVKVAIRACVLVGGYAFGSSRLR